MSLPPFSEFDWKDEIEDIFIINRGGICLFHKSIETKTDLLDDNLISGAISSINVMIEELTHDKGVSVINKKGKSIIIYPGKFVSGIIFSKKDLNNIKLVLKDFIERFETIYSNILIDWDGNIEIFKPIDTMAKKMFL
ncbi:MAG: hypothetical protein ACTSQJ_01920 [Promethearchaeota archaeon]